MMGTGYFQRVYAHIAGNPKLREPQIEAYLKVKEHFETGKTVPALVVMPTGTGKTGLLALVPFGIANNRVLVITPSLVIRDGIIRSLDSGNLVNFWHQTGVIQSRRNLPEVVEYGPDLPLEILEHANFVIVNIHKTHLARANSLLGKVPRNFFDMVIIDEAHHSAAQSWVDVEKYFAGSKVVKLTGTPWRTDNAQIYAEEVYNYPLGRAMVRGYVKHLINKTWLPEALSFTVTENGESRTLTYEDAMEIKEADWVSRHVAYSPECNRLVVDQSLQLMRTQRETTGNAHKIIAVAMTIEHAQAIRDLYRQAGVQAEVISSDMEDDEKDKVLNDFENDRAQVLVNVNMLGEGFDHPLISVGAVFRPFRSLLPYVQFAGRALRTIPDGTVVDNTAHLVYHRALNLEPLWDYFRQEMRRAEVIKHLVEAEKEWTMDREESERATGPAVVVSQGEAYEVFQESFSDEADFVAEYEAALAEIRTRAQDAAQAIRDRGIQVDDDLVDYLVAQQENSILPQKRPDAVFREQKKWLPRRIQDGVAEILSTHGLDPKDHPYAHVWPKFRNYYWLVTEQKIMTLDGFLVALINCQLKEFIGLPRSQWGPADYTRAEPVVEEYLSNLNLMLGGRS